MKIPYKQLDQKVLYELLKEIVTRDGTDYGNTEVSTEEKISSALGALKHGKADLYWDADSETASLKPADQ
tara:strand:+ start:389 stop:598 length:210 start_codon:yes stop_codon:yes gene_type:complete